MFVDVLISFEEFREYGSKRLGLGRAACLRVDAFIVDVLFEDRLCGSASPRVLVVRTLNREGPFLFSPSVGLERNEHARGLLQIQRGMHVSLLMVL